MSIGRDVLASRAGFKFATVDVPEWGGSVRVRELSAAEVAEVQALAMAAVADGQIANRGALLQFQAQVVIAGWVDDAGANVLTGADTVDILAQPAAIVARLAETITKLSGMGASGPAVEAAKNA